MWVYYSPTGSTSDPGGAKTIKTLGQVAAENREPDLLELLQAAVPRGSLGLVTGSQNATDLANANQEPGETMRKRKGSGAGTTWEMGKNNATPEMRVDVDNQIVNSQPKYQIFAIAANLIDQADSDSFPTTLRINSENFYGIEDIPRLFGAGLFTFRPPAGNAVIPNAGSAFVHQMAMISVWNPHLPALTAPSEGPDTFRVICRYGFGGFYFRSSVLFPTRLYGASYLGVAYNEPLGWRSVGRDFQVNPAWIQFDSTFSGGMRDPVMLAPPGNVTCSDPVRDRLTINGTITMDVTGMRTGYIEVPDSQQAVPAGSARPDRLPRVADPYAGPPPTPVPYPPVADAPDPLHSDVYARQLFWNNLSYMNLELQYRVSPNVWRTYDAIYSFNPTTPGLGFNYLLPADPDYQTVMLSGVVPASHALWQKSMVANNNYRQCDPAMTRPDPRSTRMNMANMAFSGTGSTIIRSIEVPTNKQLGDSGGGKSCPISGPYFYASNIAGTYKDNYIGNSRFDYGYMANNSVEALTPGAPGVRRNYSDPDYVQRWGDGGGRTGGDPNDLPSSSARPVILNRPFRNVGEIGAVFRDTPWRTLDLLSEKSADAGLLEIFTVGESAVTTVAGRVNLNSASRPVLEALLTGSDLNQASSPTTISSNSATSLATDILNRRSTNGPIENLSQLAAFFPQTNTVSTAYPAPKNQREGAVRAFAGVGTTRTWNLLIDVIAQSGRLTPNAANLESDFIVQGQKRFWLNVSMDRFTGNIVASQLESYEE
jgi:hypothetical protein